jgi:hypothetical protein
VCPENTGGILTERAGGIFDMIYRRQRMVNKDFQHGGNTGKEHHSYVLDFDGLLMARHTLGM